MLNIRTLDFRISDVRIFNIRISNIRIFNNRILPIFEYPNIQYSNQLVSPGGPPSWETLGAFPGGKPWGRSQLGGSKGFPSWEALGAFPAGRPRLAGSQDCKLPGLQARRLSGLCDEAYLYFFSCLWCLLLSLLSSPVLPPRPFFVSIFLLLFSTFFICRYF